MTVVLRVSSFAEKIKDQPSAGLGEGFASLTEQRRIYDYFAVPLDQTAKIRVLHSGDDLPGLEITY